MTQDPTRDELDAGDTLAKSGDEVASTELEDLEVVDSDDASRGVERLMKSEGPPAPDPAAIAARLAAADVEGLVGDAETSAPAASRQPRSLADRMTFDSVQKPAPKRRPEVRRTQVEPKRSALQRFFGRLFGRSD